MLRGCGHDTLTGVPQLVTIALDLNLSIKHIPRHWEIGEEALTADQRRRTRGGPVEVQGLTPAVGVLKSKISVPTVGSEEGKGFVLGMWVCG